MKSIKKGLEFIKRKKKTGFTLIELLVVVGILAVLIAITLIAINPLEMLNKSTDVAVSAVTKDVTSAAKYFYTREKTTPWVKDSTCADELSTKDTLSQMPSCTNVLTEGGQLQSKLINSAEAKEIYTTQCGESLAFCYKPKSNAFKKDKTAIYQRNGAPNPKCPGDDNCYSCDFTTNEAAECFKIMGPNTDELAIASSGSPGEVQPVVERPSAKVCGDTGGGQVLCMADVVTDSAGNQLTTLALPNGLSPEQLHKAYNLPCKPGGQIDWKCDIPSTYGPETVAIVGAFHNPTMESDLAIYNETFGLPPCTIANGCLTIVNQNGQTSPLPTGQSSAWAEEAALDVQSAHATCQTCKILLVETDSNTWINMGKGTQKAAQMGATVVSNSYGNNEIAGYHTQFDNYYDNPGVPMTASSGDWGYGSFYPASNKNVIGVGGTELHLFYDNTYASEKVWNGAGSGCSTVANSAGTHQTSLPNWSQVGCGDKKAVSDVSAIASPYTGMAFYIMGRWRIFGGTSLSSPIYAATIALQGGIPQGADSVSFPYTQKDKFRDITVGSNGGCGGKSICTAGAGYDGPTGLGTPNLILGVSNLPSPTPTPGQHQYALSDSKALATYALFFFNPSENALQSGEQGWYLDVSFRSDFGGVIADHKYNPYLYYNPNDADTVLTAAYTSPGKFSTNPNSPISQYANSITTNETAYFSVPYIWKKYYDGCGKTLYWRLRTAPTNTTTGPTHSITIDCTTTVGAFSALGWYDVYDAVAQTQKKYDQNYDYDNSGVIDYKDYVLLSLSTKMRGGGWEPPEKRTSYNGYLTTPTPDQLSTSPTATPTPTPGPCSSGWTSSLGSTSFNASPGGTLNQSLTVTNNLPASCPSNLILGTSYTLPAGFQFINLPTQINIKRNESTTIYFSIKVPGNAAAQDYFPQIRLGVDPPLITTVHVITLAPTATPTPTQNCSTQQTFWLDKTDPVLALPGDDVVFTLYIKNNDTSNCSSQFTISYGYPTGWNMTGLPSSTTITGGQTKSFPFSLTVPQNTTAGTRTIQVFVAKHGQNTVNPVNGYIQVQQVGPTNTPTPTPISCNHMWSQSMGSLSMSGNAGDTLNNYISVTNNNPVGCASTLYVFSYSYPSGWIINGLQPPSATIAPGETKIIPITIGISTGAQVQDYGLQFWVNNGSNNMNTTVHVLSASQPPEQQQFSNFNPKMYGNYALFEYSYNATGAVSGRLDVATNPSALEQTTGPNASARYGFASNYGSTMDSSNSPKPSSVRSFIVSSPQSWNGWQCGQTIYYRMYNSGDLRIKSPVQSGVVDCTTVIDVLPWSPWYSAIYQGVYDSRYDVDNNGIINYDDYWLLVRATRLR